MDDARWGNLNPKNTILFLGSGFSMEATNKTNANFLDGTNLAKHLQNVIGDEDAEVPSLRQISDDFIPKHQGLLNETLQPLMTTTKVSPDQARIIKKPWRRVYTTNYDDVFEFGMLKEKLTPNTVSFDSPVVKAPKGTQIVHLHGSIHDCSNENIDDKLVLTERSYVRQLAQTRPWFDEFMDDARFSQSIVFLGYSLMDTPITALLLGSSEIRDKTAFVIRGEPTGRYKRNLSLYGSIRPIALSGFADHLDSISKKSPTTPKPTMFSAFTEMNAKKDGKPLVPATAIEVRNLLTYGRFNVLACAASWPEATYLIPRKKLVDKAISSFAVAKTILVHSRSSNGKSLFSEMLAVALSQMGWRCLRSKSSPNLSDDDINLLKSTQRPVLFFKSLDDANYVMKQLGTPPSGMRFVVEVSTSIADVRAHALGRQLTLPIERINVNMFDQEDRDHFETILSKAGIRPNDFSETFGKCTELRDFLLRLYENQTVKDNLIAHAQPLWELPSVRRAMTTVFALKVLELDVSPTFKREIVGEDPLTLLDVLSDDLREHAFDFFDFQDSSVEPYSAVISQLLLANFLTSQDIVDWALNAGTIAARRKQEQLQHGQQGPRFTEANKVLGRVLQVTRMRALLADEPNSTEMIRALFEKARHVNDINLEPLFWLQFAISWDEEHATRAQLNDALEFLHTAYSRADDLELFDTYQLDTHHLRLLLRIETHVDHEGTEFQHWDQICKLLSRFSKMLSDDSHRGFALRVLELVEPFINERRDSMDISKKAILEGHLNIIVEALGIFDESAKQRYPAEAVRFSIQRAIHRLDGATGNGQEMLSTNRT
ncbi:SIR2 family protein [Pseudophaeobacter sp.]|uniref:SIR2 family protein n=1 Tax=Pseudophaeobacter sp. TaxID=1971739 RepID=UPI0032973D10